MNVRYVVPPQIVLGGTEKPSLGHISTSCCRASCNSFTLRYLIHRSTLTMGYDANIKSGKAKSRQRSILYISTLGLLLAAFTIVSLRKSNVTSSASAPNKISINASPFDPAAELNSGSKISRLKANTEHNGDAKLEAAAAVHVSKLDEEVRALKRTGIIMEKDPHALELTKKLQRATTELIKLRYGEIRNRDARYRVRMELEFQSTIPDWEERGKEGSVLIELAPIGLLPCSVSDNDCSLRLGFIW